MYKVIWSGSTTKDFKKVDIVTSKKIAVRVESHLAQNPHKLGKALIGEWSGFRRYRYGNYRIIYNIIEQQITIVVVKIGHRSEIYE